MGMTVLKLMLESYRLLRVLHIPPFGSAKERVWNVQF